MNYSSSSTRTRYIVVALFLVCATVLSPPIEAQTQSKNIEFREPARYDEVESVAYDIFKKRCNECHGSRKPSDFWYSVDNFAYYGSLDYVANLDKLIIDGTEDYIIDCSDAQKSKLMKQIISERMPDDAPALKSEEKKKILHWIKHGCKKLAQGQFGNITNAQLADRIPYAGDPIKQEAWRSLNNHCSSCHNIRSVNGGGGLYRILDLDWLARGDGPKPYVDACTPNNSLLLKMIHTGSMPKGSPINDVPSFAEDVAAIENWIHSLIPESVQNSLTKHKPLKQGELYRLALSNLDSLHPSKLAHIRFISLALPYNTGVGEEDLKLFGSAVGKLMNLLSSGSRIVKPVEVNGSRGLLFRIDLRDYGWTPTNWIDLEKAYPYGRIPFRDQRFMELQNMTQATIPIIRGDWMAFAASRPPLYYDLLRLPSTVEGLEHYVGGSEFSPVINLRERRVIRAGYGAGESGVSFNSRLIERHDLPGGGVYWKSYDFGGKNRRQNLEETPFGPTVPNELASEVEGFIHDGGEYIFSLPNGLHGYFLATEQGQRIDTGPSEIVQDSSRMDRIITNGLSCISCHASGIQIRPDAIRDDVLSNPRFSHRAKRVLTELHPSPDRLARVMLSDEQDYLYELRKLDLAVASDSGRLVPVLAGDGIEPVRYLSDWHEEALNVQRVAAEFDLSLEELRQAAVGNKAATYFARSSCYRIPRATFQDEFVELLPIITEDKPKKRISLAAVPHVPEASAISPLNLNIELPKDRFSIGDEFSFFITAKQKCQFIVFTIDVTGSVEVHDPSLVPSFMGPPILQAGERRRIPVRSPDSSRKNVAFIDPPTGLEQIGAVCSREGLSALGISDYELKTPAGRGGVNFTKKLEVFRIASIRGHSRLLPSTMKSQINLDEIRNETDNTNSGIYSACYSMVRSNGSTQSPCYWSWDL